MDSLIRFKSYLALIIKEGIESVEKSQIFDQEDYCHEKLWPEINHLQNNLIVYYESKSHCYKENNFVDYVVKSISGCGSGWSLKQKLKELFQPGFEKLITEIQKLKIDEQINIIEGLKEEIENLKSLVDEGIYVENESEFGGREEYRFKRFPTSNTRATETCMLYLMKVQENTLTTKSLNIPNTGLKVSMNYPENWNTY